MPRASEHISEMLELVERLLAAGIAYQAADGIYFSVSKFPRYGRLSKIKLDQNTQERIKNDENDKKSARDFALWKYHTADDGDVAWEPASVLERETAIKKGRPGWHIECSAMSMKYLGEHFDIHTGGTDLIFPHHENEIAQSEAATGQPFVNYWLHSGFVNINSEKMSKSLGNTLRLDDLVQEGVSPLAYRYWLLTAHYRTTINFTLEAGQATQVAYRKLVEQFLALGQEIDNVDRNYKTEFQTALADDLNTPTALALVWQMLKDNALSPAVKRAALLDFDQVLGLDLANAKPAEIPADVKMLAQEREQARQKQDWTKADQIRQQVENLGFVVEDSEKGPRVKKAENLLSPAYTLKAIF